MVLRFVKKTLCRNTPHKHSNFSNLASPQNRTLSRASKPSHTYTRKRCVNTCPTADSPVDRPGRSRYCLALPVNERTNATNELLYSKHKQEAFERVNQNCVLMCCVVSKHTRRYATTWVHSGTAEPDFQFEVLDTSNLFIYLIYFNLDESTNSPSSPVSYFGNFY